MVHKMENVKLLNNHESVTSQESIEMEEYSDEEDEVFVRGKNITLFQRIPYSKKFSRTQYAYLVYAKQM